MSRPLIITLMTDDKPGIVETLSDVINSHNASWQESRFSHLSGKFAGILRIEAEDSTIPALTESLNKLQEKGINLTVETAQDQELQGNYQEFELNVVGNDRPGIVREISKALAALSVNVLDLETYTEGAAWTGELLFHADAVLLVPEEFDGDKLVETLEAISNDMMVDFNLAKSY